MVRHELKSIRIRNFKSIVDITVNMTRPFNLLFGHNCVGKTNVLSALHFLTAMQQTTDTLTSSDFKRYRPDHILNGSTESVVYDITIGDVTTHHEFARDPDYPSFFKELPTETPIRSVELPAFVYMDMEAIHLSSGSGGSNTRYHGIKHLKEMTHPAVYQDKQIMDKFKKRISSNLIPGFTTIDAEHDHTFDYVANAKAHTRSLSVLSSSTIRAMSIYALEAAEGTRRAFRNKCVFLIDEPFLGMDYRLSRAIWGILHALSIKGRQMFLTTSRGRILDYSNPDELVGVVKSGNSIFNPFESAGTVVKYYDDDHTMHILDSWREEYSLSELYEKNVLFTLDE